MWGYYWGFTAQEIELMAIDQPIVVYDHKNKEKKKFGKVNKLNYAIVEREWKEKYEGRENEKIKLDFSQFDLGNNKAKENKE